MMKRDGPNLCFMNANVFLANGILKTWVEKRIRTNKAMYTSTTYPKKFRFSSGEMNVKIIFRSRRMAAAM